MTLYICYNVLVALLLLGSRKCSALEDLHLQPPLPPTSTKGSPVSKTRTRRATSLAPSPLLFNRLELRADCPVPCELHSDKRVFQRTDDEIPGGYYDQLCCAPNETCITDVNTQAQCSATGFPSMATFTVTKRQELQTVTVTKEPLLTILIVPDTTTRRMTTTINSVSTVVFKKTIVETRTQRISASPTERTSKEKTSTTTATSSTSTTAIPERHTMSTAAKAGIGTGVGAGVLVIVGILGCLWKKSRDHGHQQGEDDRQRLGRGGDADIQMVETAHIDHRPSQRAQGVQDMPNLVPRAPTPLHGPHPFVRRSNDDGPPFDAEASYLRSGVANAEGRVPSPGPMLHYEDGNGGDGRRSRRGVRGDYRNANDYGSASWAAHSPRNTPQGPVGGRHPRLEGEDY